MAIKCHLRDKRTLDIVRASARSHFLEISFGIGYGPFVGQCNEHYDWGNSFDHVECV